MDAWKIVLMPISIPSIDYISRREEVVCDSGKVCRIVVLCALALTTVR